MTKSQIEQVVDLKDNQQKTWEEISTVMGFSQRTAQRRYKAHFNLQNRPLVYQHNFSFERFEPLVQTGNALVTSDYHIPLHDINMVNSLIRIAKENKIKKLIIAGDYLHLDTFSHYAPHQPEAAFEIEKAEASYIMNALLEHFEEIDMIWGNHDFRITKFLDFKLSFEYCMRWILSDVKDLDRVRISELDYMFYKTSERTFRISHQKNFSKIPLTVPRQLAMKYGTSCIATHSHHCAQGVALDGYNLIFEAGGLFDKSKTEYIQKTTTHHEWVPGFIQFKNEIPTLYSPLFNNL